MRLESDTTKPRLELVQSSAIELDDFFRMSVNPPPPFGKISDDILLYILTINADLFSDGQALNRTRIASQVCHQWRSLMLGTSFLWARLVDMDTIYREPDHKFGHEVVRRSGTAPLWIRVNSTGLDPSSTSFKQFFSSVIGEHWKRIQKLVIHGWSSHPILNRSILSFPAPLLEEFEGELPEETESVDSFDKKSSVPLFSNQAPMLRRFCLRGHVIDPEQASWLGSLHYIELDHSYRSANALLAVLSATYNLQELRISDVSKGDLLTTLPIVSLPHLKLLHYDSTPSPSNSGAPLLGQIKIPLDCVLSIQISYLSDYGESEHSRQQLLSVVNSCVHYAERYLRSYRLDIIYLDYSQSDVTGVSFTRETTVPIGRHLANSIPQYNDYDSSQYRMLTQQIARLDILSIAKIHLRAEGIMNPYWEPFFSCFTSLETMFMDRNLLNSLSHIQTWLDVVTTRLEKSEVIWPRLNFVEFAIRKKNNANDMSIVALRYAMPRLRCGHSISTLDIPKHLPLENPSDLDSFTEVKGLKDVKLMCKSANIEGVFEYTCGSDCPENRIDL